MAFQTGAFVLGRHNTVARSLHKDAWGAEILQGIVVFFIDENDRYTASPNLYWSFAPRVREWERLAGVFGWRMLLFHVRGVDGDLASITGPTREDFPDAYALKVHVQRFITGLPPHVVAGVRLFETRFPGVYQSSGRQLTRLKVWVDGSGSMTPPHVGTTPYEIEGELERVLEVPVLGFPIDGWTDEDYLLQAIRFIRERVGLPRWEPPT